MIQHQDLRRSFEQIAETRRIFLAAEHALSKEGPVILLISSASQGEGKSLISSALAAAAAKLRQQPTLAMDLNWYKPTLHQFFGMDRRGHLEDYLKNDLKALVQPTGLEHLDILTAPMDDDSPPSQLDRPDPNPALKLLKQATANYQLTIIDTASVFPTNRMMMDPVMLATMVDGVALVVQSATTSRQVVKRSQKVIETAGGNVVGVITNQRRVS